MNSPFRPAKTTSLCADAGIQITSHFATAAIGRLGFVPRKPRRCLRRLDCIPQFSCKQSYQTWVAGSGTQRLLWVFAVGGTTHFYLALLRQLGGAYDGPRQNPTAANIKGFLMLCSIKHPEKSSPKSEGASEAEEPSPAESEGSWSAYELYRLEALGQKLHDRICVSRSFDFAPTRGWAGRTYGSSKIADKCCIARTDSRKS